MLTRADVKERFANIGSECVPGSAAEFAATINTDMALMGKVIKDSNIRGD